MDRQLKKIIIHCTDSPDTLDIGFEDINRWHKERGFTPFGGWVYCGYHYVVKRDGSVFHARPDDVAGVHCAGHNSDSIGIVWVGRTEITKEQKQSVFQLCHNLMGRYNLSLFDVFGHHQFNVGKTCPNLNMDEFRAELEAFRQYMGGENGKLTTN